MRNTRKFPLVIAVGALLSTGIVACSSTASPNNSENNQGSVEQFSGRGPFTYVQGKDNAGELQGMLDIWNEAHPEEKVTLVELSTEADEQRESMVNTFQTESDAYCVVSVDNVWVPEFAARGWIMEMPATEFAEDEFIAPAWETGLYQDKVFAVPFASDGGILYARTDILKQAGISTLPESWGDMVESWEIVRQTPGFEDIAGYAGQFYKYEGFTVNAAEAINTNGGVLLDGEGKPAASSPESEAGLQRLVDGFASGFIPEESLTYKEEEGRAAFEDGRLLFYRNWPYQYVLTSEAIGEDNFQITALPTVDGHAGVSSLGGHNVGISRFCENRASALDFVKWYTDGEQQQYMLEKESLAPVWTSLYENETNQEAFPYLEALLTSIENAVPRPRAVQYGDVSSAIQDSLWPVLRGETSPKEALISLDDSLAPLTAND